jgi:hypothetical protein
MLRSTPIAALLETALVLRANNILDHRQARCLARALGAPQDHPAHQILPANFRLGELYRHEGATGHLSSTGWRRPEKTHRSLGSRLAQQVTKLVTHNTEYGFDLVEKVDLPRIAADVRIDDPGQAVKEVCIEQANQLTLFTDGAKGTNFGASIAWRENGSWKTRSMPLGKYLTIVEAKLFAIHMAVKEAELTAKRTVEIVSDSQKALTAIEKAGVVNINHLTLVVKATPL